MWCIDRLENFLLLQVGYGWLFFVFDFQPFLFSPISLLESCCTHRIGNILMQISCRISLIHRIPFLYSLRRPLIVHSQIPKHNNRLDSNLSMMIYCCVVANVTESQVLSRSEKNPFTKRSLSDSCIFCVYVSATWAMLSMVELHSIIFSFSCPYSEGPVQSFNCFFPLPNLIIYIFYTFSIGCECHTNIFKRSTPSYYFCPHIQVIRNIVSHLQRRSEFLIFIHRSQSKQI